MEEENKISVDDIILKEIKADRMEVYHVYLNSEQVGYIQLKYGILRVEYPEAGGELLLRKFPKGDNVFELDERNYYLEEAKKAIVIRAINSLAPIKESSSQEDIPDENKPVINDYRIGNYILDEYGEVGQIVAINSEKVFNYETQKKIYIGTVSLKSLKSFDWHGSQGRWLEKCNPIVISDEWLLRLGFSIEDNIATYSGRQHEFSIYTDSNKTWKPLDYKGGFKHLYFVHEIQNLIHALTGEEIILKYNP
ncbi:hypothetical protein J2810_004610 [Chryseobacterium rhizosphaerae]|uniref:hypothetical protein n=1 Tax=Chryseobacterium rhizosphaerae TaxID=395937 RepID=UPI00285DCD4B|nr:hypothetical protein [Chryseobacterium rhizosphaerae]MDR6548520.1 hypothetical protein [Chryseobacterium rhizosphaerae]